jgi:type VI secretion system protein ImpF
MARDSELLPVSLPLLDRLTDDEQGISYTRPDRAKSIRELKRSLRRDLEWLFNSRANHELPPDLPEVARSVYNYGLPDYSHLSLNSFGDRQRMQKQLEIAINLFEPRLAGITVRLTDNSFEPGRALRFQIDGFLKMDPAPERISFDTVLDIPSGEYQIKGAE